MLWVLPEEKKLDITLTGYIATTICFPEKKKKEKKNNYHHPSKLKRSGSPDLAHVAISLQWSVK